MKFTFKHLSKGEILLADAALITAALLLAFCPAHIHPVLTSINHFCAVPFNYISNMFGLSHGGSHFGSGLQSFPLTVLLLSLGFWCFSRKGSRARQVPGVKPTKNKQPILPERSAISDWFNSVRGEAGRVCFVLAFINLVGMFDHDGHQTICAIAVFALGNMLKDRSTEVEKSWDFQNSPNPRVRIDAGEYMIIRTDFDRDLVQIVEIGTSVVTGYLVTKDFDPNLPEEKQILVHYDLMHFIGYSRKRGSLEELRKLLADAK